MSSVFPHSKSYYFSFMKYSATLSWTAMHSEFLYCWRKTKSNFPWSKHTSIAGHVTSSRSNCSFRRVFSGAMEKKQLHSFYTCSGKCSDIPEAERARIQAQKKQQNGKERELMCSNTHGSLSERLCSETKQVNINNKQWNMMFNIMFDQY